MQMKNIETMSPRIYISFYISLFLHLSILLLAIYPFSHAMELICGIDEPVIVKEESSTWEDILSMEFSMESNSDSSESGELSGEYKGKSKGEGDKGNEQEVTSSKLDIDSLL